MFMCRLDHQNCADGSARVGPRLLRNCREWSGVAPIATDRRQFAGDPNGAHAAAHTDARHTAPAAHAIDGKSMIAIAAIAAKSPQAQPSIPPSHGYVSAASR
jgi:hypothetical protein